MIRNLKALGLAVVAVLAMSAVAASAAQAEGELTVEGGGTAELHGEQSGAHTLTLPAGRVLSCTSVTSTGEAPNGATELALTPTYSGCSAKIGESVLPATITRKSCYFFYTLQTKTFGPVWDTLTHLLCTTAGDDMEIHLYLNVLKHAENTPLCTYTAQPQTTGGATVQATNMAGTPNDFTITTINDSLVVTRVFGTLGNCGAVNTTSTYNGNTTITGKVGGVAKGTQIS